MGSSFSKEKQGGSLLDAFCQRLLEFRRDYGQGPQSSREQEIQIQAEWARSLACENDLLIQPDFTWQSLRDAKDCFVGSEHFVDANPEIGRIVKITIPPAFGLLPGIVEISQGYGRVRSVIEAIDATPIEYLKRWIANNDVFQDDVHLESVIQWSQIILFLLLFLSPNIMVNLQVSKR